MIGKSTETKPANACFNSYCLDFGVKLTPYRPTQFTFGHLNVTLLFALYDSVFRAKVSML